MENGQNRKTSAGGYLVRDWEPAFLAALRETGVVRDALEAAGIGRSVVYARKDADPAFAAAWADALEDAADLLEREAIRRARTGVREPVIYKGQLCGVWVDGAGLPVAEGTPGATMIPLSVTKYSDGLLIFLLKGARPAKYKDTSPDAGKPPPAPLVIGGEASPDSL